MGSSLSRIKTLVLVVLFTPFAAQATALYKCDLVIADSVGQVWSLPFKLELNKPMQIDVTRELKVRMSLYDKSHNPEPKSSSEYEAEVSLHELSSDKRTEVIPLSASTFVNGLHKFIGMGSSGHEYTLQVSCLKRSR
jgi:hypothetical protein